MTVEMSQADPVFDPANVGESLDVLREQLPMRDQSFRGTVVGEFASSQKGSGFDINGVRDYVLGDDTRHVDWRATARQPDHQLQVREHYRDTMPALWVVTDALQSRNEVNPGYFSEQQLALSAVTGLIRIANLQGMPSAVIASDDYETAIAQRQPMHGKVHLRRTAQMLADVMLAEASEDTTAPGHLAELLRYGSQRCMGSIVAVVSDFREVADPDDAEQGWKTPLEDLIRRGNQLVAVEVTNPWDYRLPATVDRFTTREGVLWVGNDKQGQRQRAQYEADAQAQQVAIDDALAGIKAHHIKLSTAEPQWLGSFRDQLRPNGAYRKA